ncbi:MAG: hypothetical protein U0905_13640 [Pirellulales bacterium]
MAIAIETPLRAVRIIESISKVLSPKELSLLGLATLQYAWSELLDFGIIAKHRRRDEIEQVISLVESIVTFNPEVDTLQPSRSAKPRTKKLQKRKLEKVNEKQQLLVNIIDQSEEILCRLSESVDSPNRWYERWLDFDGTQSDEYADHFVFLAARLVNGVAKDLSKFGPDDEVPDIQNKWDDTAYSIAYLACMANSDDVVASLIEKQKPFLVDHYGGKIGKPLPLRKIGQATKVISDFQDVQLIPIPNNKIDFVVVPLMVLASLVVVSILPIMPRSELAGTLLILGTGFLVAWYLWHKAITSRRHSKITRFIYVLCAMLFAFEAIYLVISQLLFPIS